MGKVGCALTFLQGTWGSRGQGTARQGMECPREQQDRVWGAPGHWGQLDRQQHPSRGWRMAGEAMGCPRGQWGWVPAGDGGQQNGHQGPSRGVRTLGWAWGCRGTAGKALGSLQGTRRWQQPQVQPDGFPLFPRSFVPQFPSSHPLPKAGTGSRTLGGGKHFEHVPPPHAPVSPAPTRATSTSPSSHPWGSSWPPSS